MTMWHPIALEGVRLIELGKIEEGRHLLRQAVSSHPFEAWPYLKLAEVEESINSKIHLYEKSLEVEVTDWAFIGLIRTHVNEDRLEAAYRCYARARRTLEDITRLRDLLPRMVEVAGVFEDSSFDWRAYLAKRPTLLTKDKNPVDVAVKHYLDVGRYSHHLDKAETVLEGGFNAGIYRLLNPEINDLSDEQVLTHFFDYNVHDAPLYSLKNVPTDFDPARYRQLNSDLAAFLDREAVVHFVQYAAKEKRMYNTGFMLTDAPVLGETELADYAKYRNNCVVLINHEASLSGAPLFFQAFVDALARERYF